MLHQRFPKLILSLLLLFAFSEKAEANDFVRGLCRMVFGEEKVPAPAPDFNYDNLKLWKQTFSLDGEFLAIPSLHRGTLDHEATIIWWMFERLPQPIHEHLLHLGHEHAPIRSYFSQILKLIEVPTTRSYLAELGQKYFEFSLGKQAREKRITFSEWAYTGLARLDKLRQQNPDLEKQYAQTLEKELLTIRANLFWDTFGEVEVPLVKNGDPESTLRLHGKKYRVIQKSNSLIVKNVERKYVKHPEWNPLDFDYIQKLGMQMFRSDPKIYPAIIGLDGNFYLVDRNHRFEVSGQEFVDIEISAKHTTVNLAAHLDLVGIPQPSLAEQQAFYQKQKRLDQIIPADKLRQIPMLDPGVDLF